MASGYNGYQYGLETYGCWSYWCWQYRYSIGVDKIGKKNFGIFWKILTPKIAQKMVKNCQNLSKFGKKWPKYWIFLAKIIQNWPILLVLVLYRSSKNFFLCCIGLKSIFGPKMTLVLELGRKFFEIFFYRIGLESDFLAKNFGYWCWVDLTKIQVAALCCHL